MRPKQCTILSHITSASPLLTSSSSSRTIQSEHHRHFRAHQLRSYAQPADDPPRQAISPEEHSWPQSKHNRTPTPYEILNCAKGTPYSKRAFYELAKIYHPDRDSHSTGHIRNLSKTVKLERYRLIVEAHEILSDPARKQAYDNWGYGWAGHGDTLNWKTRRRAARENDDYDFVSAAHNATWEDWERWYHRRDRQRRQEPRFTSNESFVGLMVVFITIGASLELGRASKMSHSFREQVTARHMMVQEGLVKRKENVETLDGKDARVKNFLKVRDSGYQESEPLPPPAPPPWIEGEQKSLPPPASGTSGWK